MSNHLTCIVCPIGCQLTIDETGAVSGNHCRRGAEFAKTEMTNPTRMVTTTVAIEGAIHRRLPVVSSCPVPKSRVMDFVKEVQKIKVSAPVYCGDILLSDVLGLGIELIASRSLDANKSLINLNSYLY